MELLIRGARVVSPAQGLDTVTSVLVRDGKIAALGEEPNCETLEAQGLCLLPGLIDMHVHLRDPGLTYKEDILTGCAAAAAGGFTAVACMPNTRPVCDCPEVVEEILGKARGAKARVYPVAALTKGMQSKALTNFRELKKAGAAALSDDGRPVTNPKLLLEALRAADEAGLPVVYHAEKLEITDSGIMHAGEISRRLQAPGVDRAAEDAATAELIALAAASGTAVHVCHVSTAGSLSLIRDAKARGVRVTCETAPHYFTLTHEALLGRDANYRMAPPLREESDRQAVLEALRDGTVDCIATDHAPHSESEKAEFFTAPNGIIGLETSFALCYTRLVKSGLLPLGRLVQLMSRNPADILGVPGGTLEVGRQADLTLCSLEESFTVDKDKFYSKARNTPFHGMKLWGRVKYTLRDGEIIYRDGQERNA